MGTVLILQCCVVSELHEQDSSPYEGYEGKVSNEDEEYARLMARLDELEKEELAAERVDESDEEDTIPADLDMFPEESPSSHSLTHPKVIGLRLFDLN